uniref:Uncharacterized protein n=1 Tax=Arundo donax TaxID=35708 RepID=A0A0A9F0W8_ARUDO
MVPLVAGLVGIPGDGCIRGGSSHGDRRDHQAVPHPGNINYKKLACCR